MTIRCLLPSLTICSAFMSVLCVAAQPGTAASDEPFVSEWVDVDKSGLTATPDGRQALVLVLKNKSTQSLWITVTFRTADPKQDCEVAKSLDTGASETFECLQSTPMVNERHRLYVKIWGDGSHSLLLQDAEMSIHFDESQVTATVDSLSRRRVDTWVSAGLGRAWIQGGPSTDDGTGAFFRMGVSVQHARSVLSARFSYAGGPESSNVRDFGSNANDEFRDVAMLIGLVMYQSKDFRVTASTGLAITWGERVVGQGFESSGFLVFPVAETTSFSTIGIPFEASAHLGGGFLGLSAGITGYANWNPEGAFGGFTVDLCLGALR